MVAHRSSIGHKMTKNKMIVEFSDFYRDVSKKETLEVAVQRMNDFMATNSIRVINVETISDGGGSNFVNSYATVGVRLWFSRKEDGVIVYLSPGSNK